MKFSYPSTITVKFFVPSYPQFPKQLVKNCHSSLEVLDLICKAM